MDNYNFTKGKWEVIQYKNNIEVGNLQSVLICSLPVKTNEYLANALLISKAPEMFRMLNEVLELQKENYGSGMNTHLALITKVKEIEKIIEEATSI